MKQQAQRIRLKLPEQDLQFLTTGSDQPRKLKAWVDDLPLMNMGETSRQLYQFIRELNRLQIDSRQRFQLLETVRPVIVHVCSALGKHYLNRSVVLPEKARRVASLAQSLQGHLANGYKVVAVRGMRKIKDRETRQNVVLATHRAMSALTDTLVRCYQLYFPTPRNLWLEMHQLYLLAEQNGFAHEGVVDPEFKVIERSTIADAYGRALLLATAQPNQLRQQELASLYQATEQWSGLIDIKQAGDEADLFVFNLQQDRPPSYRTHASAAEGENRYIDSARLVQQLALIRAGENTNLHVPKGMNEALISHLEHAWGALTERSFKRVAESGPIQVCLGLSAMHYFSSGEVSFENLVKPGDLQILADEEENPFLKQKHRPAPGRTITDDEDPWAHAADSGMRRMADDFSAESFDLSRVTSALRENKQEPKTRFDTYTCHKVNTSPGGYCLDWTGDAPTRLRSGELIGLREPGFDEWAVGVVRWVKQMPKQGARFGVELLAPRAVPAGAQVLKKAGEATEFMRVLVLPALQAIGQPSTLLTPAVGFQAGSKVMLVESGERSRVVLRRKLSSTASFGQYEFHQPRAGGARRDDLDPALGDDAEGEGFDSIWSGL